ncbi:MAG: carboxypeptidase-like regulatory domain-containing protein [archaeon]
MKKISLFVLVVLLFLFMIGCDNVLPIVDGTGEIVGVVDFDFGDEENFIHNVKGTKVFLAENTGEDIALEDIELEDLEIIEEKEIDNKEGVYKFDGLDAGKYYVFARKDLNGDDDFADGIEAVGIYKGSIILGKEEKVSNINFDISSSNSFINLQGIVYDIDENPLENVQVYVKNILDSENEIASVTTNEEGVFEINGLYEGDNTIYCFETSIDGYMNTISPYYYVKENNLYYNENSIISEVSLLSLKEEDVSEFDYDEDYGFIVGSTYKDDVLIDGISIAVENKDDDTFHNENISYLTVDKDIDSSLDKTSESGTFVINNMPLNESLAIYSLENDSVVDTGFVKTEKNKITHINLYVK